MSRSNVNFELNIEGLRDLMKSQEMQDVLKSHTDGMVQECGPGYNNDIYVGNFVALSSVYTETKEAYQDNLDNNTLLKVLK